MRLRVQPSVAPSAAPSSLPSASPSLPEQQFDINVSIEMQLPGLMSEGAQGEVFDFQLGVAQTIDESIKNGDYGEPLFDLKVFANFITQERTQQTPPAGTRRLEVSGVRIILVVRILFRSIDKREKSEVEIMIGDAFNNELERETFVGRLSTQNSFFEQAAVDKVEVEGVEPEEEKPEGDDGSGGGATTLIIIACAAGGVCLALMALGVLAVRRSSSFKSLGTPEEDEMIGEEQSQSQTPTESKLAVSTEILVERQDDISTLGDPVFGLGGMMTGNAERDEQTASVGNDYDYTKQYLRAQGLASLEESRELSRDRLGSGGSFEQTRSNSNNSGAFSKLNNPVTPSVFSDEASFELKFGEGAVENRFEVTVPPGKLGMVIDTPNGGVPAVRAIKPESVLASKVQVGDRLVAVDGDDVTAMTTVQVSKLISLKSDQQRVLAFLTSRDIRLNDSTDGA